MKSFSFRLCAALLLALALPARGAVFTNNAAIAPFDTTYDNQDLVISNCTVAVDGPHSFASVRVTAAGILTHSTAPDYIVSMLEGHVLTGTNDVALSASNVLTATIAVNDLGGTITYTNALDYLLGSSNGLTTVQRTVTSTIPDGASVLISYEFNAGTTSVGLNLTVSGNLDVDAGGAINANGGGVSTSGTGQSSGYPLEGGGGGHGGYGGKSSTNSPGGNAYGELRLPATTGSSGGAGTGGPGGAGGGLIQLNVAGTLQVNGSISANGLNATNSRSGGGSGGGIWISATNLTGTGSITADGGAGEPVRGGGGGGGRIGIHAETSTFTGSILARGGNGFVAGGAGTIFLVTNSQPGLVLLDNGGRSGADTPLSLAGLGGPENVTIGGGATTVSTGFLYINSLLIKTQSQMKASPAGPTQLTLSVIRDAVIQSGGSLSADGAGYAAFMGPGAGGTSGSDSSTFGGGGGNGGFGGALPGVPSGSASEGMVNAPTTFGSGGGGTISFTNVGGAGGGVLALSVGGTLQVDGSLSANGRPARYAGGGGGSGGSLNLTAKFLAGAGTISAGGGDGLLLGGGGGGGRIAVQCANDFFAGSLTATGGGGVDWGGAGTVYTKENGHTARIVMDNGSHAGAGTLMTYMGVVDTVVSGCARFIQSYHSYDFGNLLISSNSFVFTPTNNLTVGITVHGDAVIQAGGGIIGDQRGSPAETGIGAGGSNGGGAGHGGYGGYSESGTRGIPYGSMLQPITAGSGGDSTVYALGGAGGSAIRLAVTGALTLNGILSANGGDAQPRSVTQNTHGGGGSGGSIWITAGTWSGSGTLSANGGVGFYLGGGGGGGRLAVYCDTNLFTGTISAVGGIGLDAASLPRFSGGPGTVYVKLNSSPAGTVTVDNAGITATTIGATPLELSSLDDLTVRGCRAVLSNTASVRNLLINTGGYLTASNLALTVSGDATIESGAGIVSDGIAASGPGNGTGVFGMGGGHGGYGGGTNGGAGGITYDDPLAPAATGSRGSPTSAYNYYRGGYGGGLVQLTVAGTLTLDGAISANGASGYFWPSYSTYSLGGGSGGGILLRVGTLAGAGAISANGGEGLQGGGAGGGGRIAVYYQTNLFAGCITAYGNSNFFGSGAGTLYLKPAGSSSGLLLLDNNGIAGTSTPVSLTGGTNDLVVLGKAIAYVSSSLNGRHLLIGSNSSLTFPPSSSLWPALTLNGDATIESGGAIIGDRLSSAQGGGSLRAGVGASHGGFGGSSSSGFTGGNVYGSITSPNTGGSFGFYAYGGSPGSYGGAAVRMTVAGTLSLDGTISANGGNGTSSVNSGGGSGGSIWLTVGTLAGAGSLSVNGGSAPGGAGGGAGGRIAVYYNTNLFTGAMSAYGNTGTVPARNSAGAGTVYTKANSSPSGLVVVDNGGLAGTNTPLSALPMDDFTIRGNAIATPATIQTMRNLRVLTNGWLVFQPVSIGSPNSPAVWVSGNATIEPGGGIISDGKGNSASGTGFTSYIPAKGGGGGHGGYGALNLTGYGGVYGSIQSPTTTGSRGGNGSGYSDTAPYGGYGGGAIRLSVANTLTVAGRISADGLPGDIRSGGGAGGSVWLTAGTLAGNGTISANGGAGEGDGGGGGGGRVSLGYITNTFTGTISAFGGDGAARGGAGTIFTKATASPIGRVIVDNGGVAGTNTPITSTSFMPFDLFVQGSGIVVQGSGPINFTTSPGTILSNLTVNTGGLITTLPGQTNLDLAVMGNALLTSGGAIALDGRGFTRSSGPGAGATLSNKGAGGGYGGNGGASLSGAAGGTNYGSASQPVDRGSGGAAGSGPFTGGSDGGGALRLTVGGTLTLDGGTLSANGADGLQDDSGGGAGGSIWVMTRRLAGTGVISADGGWGDLYGGGGGGGGRIAIYAPSNSFAGTISTDGGEGANPGQEGTIFTSGSLLPFDAVSHSPAGIVSNGVSSVYFYFNTPFNPGTAFASNVIVQTPLGILPETSVMLSAANPASLCVGIPWQTTPGDYSVRLGAQIEDLFGTAMSQVYTGAFTIVLPVIQGTVADTNGQPVAGVVILADTGAKATTDAGGSYTLGFEPGSTFAVAPSSGSLMFVPGTRIYTNLTASITGENYLAVSTIAPTVGGGSSGTNLWLNWNGIAGVTYQAWWSTNLADWLPYGDPIPGTNGAMGALIPMDADPQKFYRIGAVN